MESCPSTTTFVKQNEAASIESFLPFKLYFPVRKQLGKTTRKPTADVITQKFYSKESHELAYSEENLARQLKKLAIVGPREKYEFPNTESQKYGWYEVDGLEKCELFNFGKNTSQFVIEHLMNYAKIRD